MKRIVVLAMLLAAAGCHDISSEEHDLALRGLTKEDLTAPPADSAIRARVISDIRNTWLPQAYLDRGTQECAGIRFDEEKRPLCAVDETALKVIVVRADPPDRQNPVEETAYFCTTESAYWYHYAGGANKADVWLGPRKIRFRQRHDD